MAAPARITLAVAVADNGVIGRAGALPWRLPEDLKRFKAATLGKPVLMGRKTFESIGRALPGRLNIVLTRQAGWRPADPEVRVAADLDGALALAGAAPEVMVIGGSEIYALALPRASRVLVTEVHAAPEGDATLPPFDRAEWREVSRERRPADERHAHDMSFVVLERTAVNRR
jgi:dihydrofolate reductase